MNKKIILIVGIILLAYGIYSSGLLFTLVGPQIGYTTITMTAPDGNGVIWSGTYSKALIYNGKTYTANVRPSTVLNTGSAGVAFYENGVAVGGTWNVPAPDCPPCASAYYSGNYPVGFYKLRPDLYGGANCFTNKNSADTRGPIGSTFCYIDMAFIKAGTPTTCVDNGVTYNTGAEIKKYNCYSNFNMQTCPSNYYFVSCGSGNWGVSSQCYAGDGCTTPPTQCTTTCPAGQLQKPYPDCSCYTKPNETCVAGATVPCKTETGCEGTSTCYLDTQISQGKWGACIKTDINCGNFDLGFFKYIMIVMGIILIGYGLIKK